MSGQRAKLAARGLREAPRLMARTLRVLILQEDEAALDSVRTDLEERGFEVTGARSFIEAAPFIVGTRVDVLLIYLPRIEWVRRAVLNQIKRANAQLPLVAVAPPAAGPIAEKIGEMGVTLLLPADVGRAALAEVVREIGEGSLEAS